MKVVLLGTGGPRPDPHRMGPCILFSLGQDHLVFDAGRGAAVRLVQAGVPITDVGYVFITHLHFDHIGGLADLLFAAWNNARNQVIKLFGPRIFYFEDRVVTIANVPTAEQDESSSAVAAEVQVQPDRRVSVSATTLWNPHEERVDEGGMMMRWTPGEETIVNLGYRYRRDQPFVAPDGSVRYYDIDQVDFSTAAYFTTYFARLLLEKRFPPDVDVLKVDLPCDATPATPWEATRVSCKRYYLPVRPQRRFWDEPGVVGYRLGDDLHDDSPDSDAYVMRLKRVISVTPLSLDLTSRADFNDLDRLMRNG